jgi:hypothetical protein
MVLDVRGGGGGRRHVLAILPGSRKLDFNAVAALFEARKCGFASPDTAQALTGCAMGAVPPFPLNPDLTIVVEEGLLANETLFFNAGRLDRSMELDTKVLGTKPGNASSVKMLRSVIVKGIEALAVESFVTAERQGILKEVMGCLGDIDAGTFAGSLAMLTQTHIVHAHRRWEEMGLVAQTLRETGVDPLMTEAIEKSHRRTVDAHIAPADGKVPSLEDALKLLSEKVVRGR